MCLHGRKQGHEPTPVVRPLQQFLERIGVLEGLTNFNLPGVRLGWRNRRRVKRLQIHHQDGTHAAVPALVANFPFTLDSHRVPALQFEPDQVFALPTGHARPFPVNGLLPSEQFQALATRLIVEPADRPGRGRFSVFRSLPGQTTRYAASGKFDKSSRLDDGRPIGRDSWANALVGKLDPTEPIDPRQLQTCRGWDFLVALPRGALHGQECCVRAARGCIQNENVRFDAESPGRHGTRAAVGFGVDAAVDKLLASLQAQRDFAPFARGRAHNESGNRDRETAHWRSRSAGFGRTSRAGTIAGNPCAASRSGFAARGEVDKTGNMADPHWWLLSIDGLEWLGFVECHAHRVGWAWCDKPVGRLQLDACQQGAVVMWILLLILLAVTGGLIALLWTGTLLAQGYFYDSPTDGLEWR